VSVAGQVIAPATVEHWMSVAGVGRGRPDSRAGALEFLISAEWLLGEARARGVSVSGSAVQRGVQARREDLLAGDEGEFEQALAKTGRTVDDVRLEVQAGLASQGIRARVEQAVGVVSQARVAAFYRQHTAQFLSPEVRYFEIDNLPSQAAALKVKREAQAGRGLPKGSFRETLERPSPYPDRPAKAAAEREIFAAKVGQIGGPVKIYEVHSVFVLTKIVARAVKPLAQVQGAIEEQLLAERRRQALLAFVKAWRSRWTATTDCRAGFIVQQCRQYRGAQAPATPALLDVG